MALKVAVVDDEPIVGETLAAMLQHLGLEAKIYPSAEIALEDIPLYKPELVIVDMILGGAIDGLQLISELANNHPRIKVIPTSGDPSSDSYFRALRLRGVQQHLAKPISLEQLSKAVSEALGVNVKDLGEDIVG